MHIEREKSMSSKRRHGKKCSNWSRRSEVKKEWPKARKTKKDKAIREGQE
jgi:hypothetical protein